MLKNTNSTITKEDITQELPSRVYAVDMDEVLVNITPKWFNLVLKDLKAGNCSFSKYIEEYDEEGLQTLLDIPLTILLRSSYPLVNMFKIREEYIFRAEEIREEINNEMLKYLEDEDFYMDLPLTPFGQSISLFSNTENILKVYVLTHSYSEVTDKAKDKYLAKKFGMLYNDKVEMVNLRLDESKVDFLNDNPEVEMFAEDSEDNILDIIHNYKHKGLVLMIPSLTYNHSLIRYLAEDEEIQQILKAKEIEVKYFSTFINKEELDNVVDTEDI